MNSDGTKCSVIIISGLTDHDGLTAGKLHCGGSLRSIEFNGPSIPTKCQPRRRQCIHNELQSFNLDPFSFISSYFPRVIISRDAVINGNPFSDLRLRERISDSDWKGRAR